MCMYIYTCTCTYMYNVHVYTYTCTCTNVVHVHSIFTRHRVNPFNVFSCLMHKSHVHSVHVHVSKKSPYSTVITH